MPLVAAGAILWVALLVLLIFRGTLRDTFSALWTKAEPPRPKNTSSATATDRAPVEREEPPITLVPGQPVRTKEGYKLQGSFDEVWDLGPFKFNRKTGGFESTSRTRVVKYHFLAITPEGADEWVYKIHPTNTKPFSLTVKLGTDGAPDEVIWRDYAYEIIDQSGKVVHSHPGPGK